MSHLHLVYLNLRNIYFTSARRGGHCYQTPAAGRRRWAARPAININTTTNPSSPPPPSISLCLFICYLPPLYFRSPSPRLSLPATSFISICFIVVACKHVYVAKTYNGKWMRKTKAKMRAIQTCYLRTDLWRLHLLTMSTLSVAVSQWRLHIKTHSQ